MSDSGDRPVGVTLTRIRQAAERGDWLSACSLLESVLSKAFDRAMLWGWYGFALEMADKPHKALEAYDQALALDPCQADIAANRAALHRSLLQRTLQTAIEAGQRGDEREAERHFRAALTLDPDQPIALLGLARLLKAQWKLAQALELCALAVAVAPSYAEARYQLGLLQQQAANLSDAAASFSAALSFDPEHVGARLEYWRCCQALADWDALPAAESAVRALLDRAVPLPVFPLIMLNLTSSELLAAARRWQAAYPPASAYRRSCRGAKLHLAYLSSDLRDHSVGRLIASIWERHDRERILLTAVYTGPKTDDGVQRRLRAAVDRWYDCAALDDASAASLLRSAGIDALIDLNGLTRGARPGLIALRPAARIGCWVGYPGTTGSCAVDFALVDTIVAPPDCEADWSETLIRLPGCYLPLDTARPLPLPVERTSLGLPENAVVLASFNQAWKITEEVLSLWAESLAEAPETVLWLLDPGPLAAGRWRSHLSRFGVDPARLILAQPLPNSEHLARLAAADLALDPWPYGSHTTGADALSAGVALLSWTGATMPSRVGTSLLHAAGLGDLAQVDLAGHRRQIVDLALDPEQRAALRRHLLEQRKRGVGLFDMTGLTRAVEAALLG